MLNDKRSRKLLDACDRYDNSPLHASAQKGYLDIVIALLEAGGDVDNKNEDEQTPLHLAAAEGRTRICKEILKRDKFAVNDEDSDSNTALHLASIHGHDKVVATLIEAGADIEARNYYLWTPLDCAAAYGQPKCAKLLLDVSEVMNHCIQDTFQKCTLGGDHWLKTLGVCFEVFPLNLYFDNCS